MCPRLAMSPEGHLEDFAWLLYPMVTDAFDEALEGHYVISCSRFLASSF